MRRFFPILWHSLYPWGNYREMCLINGPVSWKWHLYTNNLQQQYVLLGTWCRPDSIFYRHAEANVGTEWICRMLTSQTFACIRLSACGGYTWSSHENDVFFSLLVPDVTYTSANVPTMTKKSGFVALVCHFWENKKKNLDESSCTRGSTLILCYIKHCRIFRTPPANTKLYTLYKNTTVSLYSLILVKLDLILWRN